ncbi:MAG: hypothetical protein LBP79_07775 [Clostridiales bacterium]|jgi:4-diphosphocytidyl-2-C-methyl-D-erythritol kinase|nr:hypothetical protein [Clostridiales bacterium]
MRKLSLRVNAKINLFLRVAGIDEIGYHILETLAFSGDICDTVEITERAEGGVSLEMPRKIGGENNALAAAEKLAGKHGLNGFGIFIDKRIPVAAGLGGSSADAAALIFGLKELYGIPGGDFAEYGGDVPFMLTGGVAAMRGGKDLSSESAYSKTELLAALKRYTFLIVKPKGEMLTRKVFAVYDEIKAAHAAGCENGGQTINAVSIARNYDESGGKITGAETGFENGGGEKDADIEALIGALIADDREEIRRNLRNDLYPAAVKIQPGLERVCGEITGCGAFACVMTGSGNAFVGLFGDKNAAAAAANGLKNRYEEVIVCRAADRGIEPIIKRTEISNKNKKTPKNF